MRLVRVDSPEAHADAVAQLAFDVGIDQVTVFPLEARGRDGSVQRKQSIDVATATPVAKVFVDALNISAIFVTSCFTYVALRFSPTASRVVVPKDT